MKISISALSIAYGLTPEALRYYEEKGLLFLPISAATRQGLDDLPGIVFDHLKELPPIQIFQPEYVKKQA